MTDMIRWFDAVGIQDIPIVGGKNASLGEMTQSLTQLGVKVPFGFATTAEAYREFSAQQGLDKKINTLLATLDVHDVKALSDTGKKIRQWIIDTSFLPAFEHAVRDAFTTLSKNHPDYAVAVRSSATAEDLANASFAGQQESYLNVRGIEDVLQKIKLVFASLFNDRAIAYRVHQGFAHADVAISVGVQQMVRSDLAASGVMFTLDTESGFDKVIFITSAYGLGEAVVQGSVNPDEFYVYKPTLDQNKDAILRKNLGSKKNKLVYAAEGIREEAVPLDAQQQFSLTDAEITQLAHTARLIEQHYRKPMDIEWAKDGLSGELLILQARPETVNSQKNPHGQKQFSLKARGNILAEGRSVGQGIGQGTTCLIHDIAEMDRMQRGFVLVTEMTDPDWEPIMSRASAIVTNRGGRTCHAAIIARELGIPAVVGCGDATQKIADGMAVTVSCAEGETGFIYEGLLDFDVKTTALETLPADLPVKIMLNVGNPDRAFAVQSVPNAGVGLARMEFIINQMAGIHPRALLEFDSLTDPVLKEIIRARTACYASPKEYYIEKIREGVSTIAAAFYPKPVIFRLSDFKSNEYANLIGGTLYEPHEENPMIGFRGAARYISPEFSACFAMECEAIKRVREKMGLDNLQIMIPFVRTLTEAKTVIDVLAQQGLKRGADLKIIMMCELPSNAVLAEQFLEYFDGFSIGSNDMTQLTLGVDRDSHSMSATFDERDPAVKAMLHLAIQACRKHKKYVGICGQGPSDHPDFAAWLVAEGIETISLNPDSVLKTIERLKTPLSPL